MSRFLTEWRQLFFAPLQIVGGLTAIVKPLEPIVIAVFGIGIYAAIALALWQIPTDAPWKVLAIAVLFVWWGSFTAGRAWEKAHEVVIIAGPLTVDVPIRSFRMVVKNGPVPVKFVGKVNRVVDPSGTRHIEHPWQGHFRGRSPNYSGDLGAFEEAEYGWLSVGSFPSNNPSLFIFSNDPGPQLTSSGHGAITISRDVPLEEQGVLTVDIIMTCTAGDGREKVLRRTFSITPDPNSKVLYKIAAQGETRPSRPLAGQPAP